MAQALYRKYRSKSLDTVVGQEHITTTLAHALKTGKLAHAYLFTGPRGVGKTSIARILAHEINGLPYTDDSTHLDIIEIDAASNRRIDEIRELRDKVHTAPSSAKYKVYIIDEVHMLTREAFNALLKTLEEPPAHAVFILATTESHKLPETIVSRTQRFMFKPVDLDKVTEHLRSIAVQEGLVITDEALRMIAAYGEGSFRDSISLLDQCRGYDGEVGADKVRILIGQPTDEAVTALLEAISQHDALSVTRTLSDLREQGFASAQIAKHLGQRLRADAIQGRLIAGLFELLAKLLDVPSAHDPETYLELVLLEHALSGATPARQAVPVTISAASVPAAPAASTQPPQTPQAVPKPAAHSQPAIPASPAPESEPEPAKTAAPPAKTAAKAVDAVIAPEPQAGGKGATSFAPLPAGPAVPEAPPPPTDIRPLDEQTWPEVLACLKQTHNTLYGIVRLSRLEFNDDHVALYFKFAFHQKRVSEAKNRDIILSAIRTTTGRDVIVKCLVEENDAPPAQAFAAASAAAAPVAAAPAASGSVTDPNILAAVNDIFGT